MRERRPAPEQQVEPRSEPAGGSLRAGDARQMASQMGNVRFTALARALARQPGEDTIEFPPIHIHPEGEARGPTIGPSGILEFPLDHVGPGGESQGPTESPDGVLEFPPDHIGPGDGGSAGETIEFPPDVITPDSSGAGAAGGAAAGAAGGSAV